MSKRSPAVLALLMILAATSAATGKTTLMISTDPAGAQYKCQQLGRAGATNVEIEVPKSAFAGQASISEQVSFTLPGYQPLDKAVTLRRGKKNTVNAKLERIDTTLTITSQPEGAEVNLSAPLLGTQTFTTPFTLEMTASAAAMVTNTVSIARVFLEGYVADPSWINRVVAVPAGRNTTTNIALAPILTTIEVLTEPEGADIEDIEPSGFGYLGVGPLRRSFTYEDLRNWASKRRVVKAQGAEPTLLNVAGFDAIQLTLRISKSGYDDTFLRGISIPIGESRSFHRALSPRVEQIRFMSDPPGTHVFVLRFTIKDTYDEATGTLRQQRVNEEKYLGTTPFTYNIDAADPLLHGERLIFRKSGLNDQVIIYSSGEVTYFVVM